VFDHLAGLEHLCDWYFHKNRPFLDPIGADNNRGTDRRSTVNSREGTADDNGDCAKHNKSNLKIPVWTMPSPKIAFALTLTVPRGANEWRVGLHNARVHLRVDPKGFWAVADPGGASPMRAVSDLNHPFQSL
jgi:hypothetical protein